VAALLDAMVEPAQWAAALGSGFAWDIGGTLTGRTQQQARTRWNS